MNTFWKNKRILVAGGTGFLGGHLAQRLTSNGAHVLAAGKSDCNFVDLNATVAYLGKNKPEIVIHAAAYYGGLAMTLEQPGRIFFENASMGVNLFEASRLSQVKKFVSIGATCSYPASDQSLREGQLWSGPMHSSVSAYGAVKRMLQIQGEAYRKQYGLASIYLVPATLYGPGDCFDEDRSHVVGDLIRKFSFAKHHHEKAVVLWGTGQSVREFLYVDDCVEGILVACERYDSAEPLNLGTGIGTPIRHLAKIVSDEVKFPGQTLWDANRPEGQSKKVLHVEKMKELLQWHPKTDLHSGVRQTVQWYESTGLKKAA